MSVSKAPAYFGLIAAVTAGAIMSGGIKSTPKVSVPNPLQAGALTPVVTGPSQPEQIPSSSPGVVATWKMQTLNVAALRIRADLPSTAETTSCVAPVPSDEEVGICRADVGGPNGLAWQLRVVTQRDRFVPTRWFDEGIQALRAAPADVLTRRLGNEANAVTKAGFINASLLSPIQLPGALAVRGAARGVSAPAELTSQSCVYALLLSQNRPTTVLFCAGDDQASLDGAQKLVASLQKYNVSTEYKRGSARGAEHAFFMKRLKAAGGAALAPDFIASEQAFERAMANECEAYPILSQERYQCHENFASARIDELSHPG